MGAIRGELSVDKFARKVSTDISALMERPVRELLNGALRLAESTAARGSDNKLQITERESPPKLRLVGPVIAERNKRARAESEKNESECIMEDPSAESYQRIN